MNFEDGCVLLYHLHKDYLSGKQWEFEHEQLHDNWPNFICRGSSRTATKWTLRLLTTQQVGLIERIPEGCPQSVSDPPTYCIRAAGVLRYNRESDNHRINLITILPESQPLTEYPVRCEYCGQKAQPSLDLTWAQGPETAPLFCCVQRQQLCKMLGKWRRLVERRCDLRASTPTSSSSSSSSGEQSATEMKELLFQGKKMEDYNKFILDLPIGLGEHSELRIYEDYSIQLPVAETFAPTSKVLSFRLSCAPGQGCWTVYPCSATEKHLKIKEQEEQGQCKTDWSNSGPSVLKEELFVLAARIRINTALRHLNQYLMTPSHPQLPKTSPSPPSFSV
ncbi:uncharacterized protein LOC116037392 [Sander lucioperca]|uniref:uncharacterized protein LOC116037392 n=1 Tax=Sander lucioperca TaxID=283035 RepID=UPI001653A278|nr:uncharacterized protein LOC116037392 [Sander lucioperca]